MSTFFSLSKLSPLAPHCVGSTIHWLPFATQF